MSDRSGNERLFRKASRENLLGVGDTEHSEVAQAPRAKRSVSPLMFVTVIVLDLIALFVLLVVNPIAGLIIFVISSAVLSSWLNARLRATRQKRGVADDR